MTKFVHDSAAVFARELKPVVRDPFSLIFSLVQPLVFLALLGPLIAGVPGMPGDNAWQWFVPGILVMIALFGTSATGSNLLYEIHTGSHERLMVAPVSRAALLVGRALKEMAPLSVQAVLIVAVMLPFGFQLYPVGAVIGLLLLGVFGVGVGALSYTLALAVRKTEWMFWVVQQSLIFPLLILSGMLMPLEMGPAWMRAAAAVNPFTHLVNAERALFSGQLGDSAVWHGALAAAATAVVGLFVGVRAMRRST